VENQHYPSVEIKDLSRKFIVSEELKTFFQNEVFPKLDKLANKKFTLSLLADESQEIHVGNNDNLLRFTFLQESLLIPFWKSNLEKIPSLLYNWLNSFTRNDNDNFVKLSKSPAMNEKKLASFTPIYSDWSLKKAEIAKLYKQNLSLQSLPVNLLELSPFDSFLSAHILIHLKGESWASSVNYNKNTQYNAIRISVADFNKLFSLIKKSKNKSFSREQIDILGIPLLGSFLANEITLSRHNVILIISRNDFLMPSKYEIQFFEDFTHLLPKYIEHLIEMEQSHLENIRSVAAMNSLPMAFKIIKNNKTVFKSLNYSDSMDSASSSFSISRSSFELKVYELEDTEKLTTDLFHFQRISLLGELLNTLRHEINNPLFGLKLATDLLDRNQFEGEDRVYIDEISNSVNRCQKIIESFTNLYQDRNASQLISLKKLIDEVLTLTKSETRGINYNIKFHNFSDDDQITVMLNPTWLAQILFNLIINSSQALKNDLQNVNKLFKIDVFNESQKIKLNISDNGPGINPEILNLIFNPFFTTKKSGTGLGLSISKNLASRMGAELNCDNLSPRGVCFTLIFKRNNNENSNN
jgi:two-component system, NtrC family, sensor kinase